MAQGEIIWSEDAKKELHKILKFYTERNGSSTYSLKLLGEIEDVLKTLSKSNFIGRLTSNKITRVVPMKVYLIFYEINNNRIEILCFWDNRQDEIKRKFDL
ncbi:type II toxin-antitoxin system RelE/ParE family toxin [Polaribacter porphyrae]|uniref:Plasmid stabilization system n=1 Tax=Polaribacter porphyrae TaxID=1137780 RepID=A0A2S7WPI8_9FLAO|nr:type II toxin-antitoxin system RelE/ParE family toxin [Polaribacter porphyrae]PQJ79528.1 plasmid stabilization system [Polaribacter porphyrae]